jgi:hypothetical protein
MESCGGSQHWARRLIEMGHRVKLMPAKFVKAFVTGNKNDSADARAIWMAPRSIPLIQPLSLVGSPSKSPLCHASVVGAARARALTFAVVDFAALFVLPRVLKKSDLGRRLPMRFHLRCVTGSCARIVEAYALTTPYLPHREGCWAIKQRQECGHEFHDSLRESNLFLIKGNRKDVCGEIEDFCWPPHTRDHLGSRVLGSGVNVGWNLTDRAAGLRRVESSIVCHVRAIVKKKVRRADGPK